MVKKGLLLLIMDYDSKGSMLKGPISPIYQPAQATDLYPRPSAYISDLTQTDIDALRVKRGQVLLTCSGTVGNCTYVRNTLDNLIFSHDLIRIEPKEYNGFIYAFLKSGIGRLLITTNNYGAVIKHIESKHLNDIPIPNPPPLLKQEIHNLIEESFKLRDESNELMDETQVLLKEALQLPKVEALQKQAEQFDKTVGVLNYSVPLIEFMNRLRWLLLCSDCKSNRARNSKNDKRGA